jgi:cytochrome c553
MTPRIVFILAVAVLSSTTLAAPDGQQIYKTLCANCHGKEGEGVKDEYAHPLLGDRSLDNLTKYIDKRMPEDDPKKCAGEDAAAVAKYIFDAFYSPAAQARRNPQRIELAHLTTGQYRNAVADLLATFGEQIKPDPQRGLRAEFYNGKNPRGNGRIFERTDATVAYDFGEEGPGDKVSKEEYAARWSGSILISESGEYEFIIETGNGARLYINDNDKPLIDVWVRSGSDRQHRERIALLAGRSYPLRMEMFKEKKEKTGGMTLKWKPPHGTDQVVPQSALSPGRAATAMVVATPFPPDDRSMGFERGTLISKAWDEATTAAAIEVAEHVVAKLQTYAGTTFDKSKAREALTQFAARFAERAFRRPLTEEQRKFFIDRQFNSDGDLETSLKKAIILVLKSPRFLYQDAAEQNDAYAIASRISFALWDSLPDKALLDAARDGKLKSREDVRRETARMLPDARTKAKMRGFYHAWLNIDHLHELSKSAKLFPGFTPAIAADLRVSLDLFLDDVTWGSTSGSTSGGCDFRRLFLANEAYFNGNLAKFYGIDLPADAPFQKVALDKQRHAGVLTHPLLMAGFAYDSESSPIHRGVFVARGLLGRRLRPPQQAQTILSPDLHPDLTTRQRIALQTSSNNCMSCHTMINPLGFTFENFDAVGRFRNEERKKPIDSSGSYQTAEGDTVTFKNVPELAAFLANSKEAHAAFVERLFQHAIRQPMLAYGLDTPQKLREGFVKSGFNIQELLIEIVASSAIMPMK